LYGNITDALQINKIKDLENTDLFYSSGAGKVPKVFNVLSLSTDLLTNKFKLRKASVQKQP
jgi:hypothetical protein